MYENQHVDLKKVFPSAPYSQVWFKKSLSLCKLQLVVCFADDAQPTISQLILSFVRNMEQWVIPVCSFSDGWLIWIQMGMHNVWMGMCLNCVGIIFKQQSVVECIYFTNIHEKFVCIVVRIFFMDLIEDVLLLTANCNRMQY